MRREIDCYCKFPPLILLPHPAASLLLVGTSSANVSSHLTRTQRDHVLDGRKAFAKRVGANPTTAPPGTRGYQEGHTLPPARARRGWNAGLPQLPSPASPRRASRAHFAGMPDRLPPPCTAKAGAQPAPLTPARTTLPLRPLSAEPLVLTVPPPPPRTAPRVPVARASLCKAVSPLLLSLRPASAAAPGT